MALFQTLELILSLGRRRDGEEAIFCSPPAIAIGLLVADPSVLVPWFPQIGLFALSSISPKTESLPCASVLC